MSKCDSLSVHEASFASEATALETWRVLGRQLVEAHRREFLELLDPIEALIASGKHAEAAAAAQVAANFAVLWHTGSFYSPCLEELVSRLGRAALPCPDRTIEGASGNTAGMSVLHVATELYAVGGHGKMIEHWISKDPENRHSLVLTRQHEPVPAGVQRAVGRSGGTVSEINGEIGGLLKWARSLQRHIARADLVVLHVHSMDVIPSLALAGMNLRPPVALLNHADHLFWLGVHNVDLVISTRLSGHRLCVQRRAIRKEATALIPLALTRPPPGSGRRPAKAALGLPADSIVVLTLARALKYKTLGVEEFPDPIVPVLAANPNLYLLAVGPGGRVDWSWAQAQVPGRILVFKETSNTAPFFDAADIYLDSFPFVSITSLLEAGSRGLPIISRHPFGDECEVMGADTPGLDASIQRAPNSERLQHLLQALIDDVEMRRSIGDKTRRAIEAANMGEGWKAALRQIYQKALTSSVRGSPIAAGVERLSDLDFFIPFAYGDRVKGSTPAGKIVLATDSVLKVAPFWVRVRDPFPAAFERQDETAERSGLALRPARVAGAGRKARFPPTYRLKPRCGPRETRRSPRELEQIPIIPVRSPRL